MDRMKIFEALNLISDDIVKDAAVESDKADKFVPDDSCDAVTVSGVEVYKRGKWHKFAAIAAALLLVAGLGSAGALLMRGGNKFTSETEKPATTYSSEPAEDESRGAAAPTDTEESSSDTSEEDTTGDTTEDTTEATTSGEVTDEPTKAGAEATTSNEVSGTTGGSGARTTAPKTTTADTVTTPEVLLPAELTGTFATTTLPQTTEPYVTTTKKVYEFGDSTIEVHMAPGEVYKWFEPGDRNIKNIIIASMGDHRFVYDDGSIYRQRVPGDAENTFPIVKAWSTMAYNAYFADLNADGYPELCISVNTGSGVSMDMVYVYDIRNDHIYYYDERGTFDFSLTAASNRLYLLRREYSIYPVPWSEADRLEPVLYSDNVGYIERNGINVYSINDIDGDSKYTVSDAYAILHYFAKSVSEGKDVAMEILCDVDNSGNVTAIDSSYYLSYLRDTRRPGDINEDDKVDSLDVSYLSHYIAHREDYNGNLNYEGQLRQSRCETYGDLNHDGRIDENDLSWFDSMSYFGA